MFMFQKLWMRRFIIVFAFAGLRHDRGGNSSSYCTCDPYPHTWIQPHTIPLHIVIYAPAITMSKSKQKSSAVAGVRKKPAARASGTPWPVLYKRLRDQGQILQCTVNSIVFCLLVFPIGFNTYRISLYTCFCFISSSARRNRSCTYRRVDVPADVGGQR